VTKGEYEKAQQSQRQDDYKAKKSARSKCTNLRILIIELTKVQTSWPAKVNS
jgi:hypothetical protein